MTVDLRDLGSSIPRDVKPKPKTESRKRNCETGVGGPKLETGAGIVRLTKDSNSLSKRMFRQIQGKRISTIFKIVSLRDSIEDKEKMSDQITLDLKRSESQESRLVQRNRNHQDTINTSIASSQSTSSQTDRTPIAKDASLSRGPNLPIGRGYTARRNSIATSVQTNTVFPCVKGNVNQICKVLFTTCTTPHPEAGPAALRDKDGSNCFLSQKERWSNQHNPSLARSSTKL